MLPLAFLSGVLHRDHWWPIVAVMLIAGMATWSQNRVFSERSNIIYDFTYRASKLDFIELRGIGECVCGAVP